MENLIELLLLGIATGFFSYTCARGTIFNPIRDFFTSRAEAQPPSKEEIPPGSSPLQEYKKRKRAAYFFKFFDELLSCPYCFSHWVAFFVAWIWQPILTDCGLHALDFIISVFLLVGISSLSWATFEKMRD